MCNLSDFASLELDKYHASLLVTELELWHQQYLPCGKNVLDIGAGCGETAQFYLKHGAQKVVCIEGDAKVLAILHRNFDDDSRVVIVPFMLDHLKIDVDGAEEGMLLETHFPPEFKQIWRDGNSETRLWRVSQIPP